MIDIPFEGDAEIASGVGLCDFCVRHESESETFSPAAWRYPCRSFELPIPTSFTNHRPLSNGDWGACEKCAELIEKGHRDKLSRRSGIMHKMGIQRKVIDLFFEHRIDRPRTRSDQPYIPFDDILIYPDTEAPGK